jgi:hypothetical protein
MTAPGAAVHQTIMAVDAEVFGGPARTLLHHLGTRAGLYKSCEACDERVLRADPVIDQRGIGGQVGRVRVTVAAGTAGMKADSGRVFRPLAEVGWLVCGVRCIERSWLST